MPATVQEAVDSIVQNDQVLRRFSPAWFVYQFDKRVTHSQALQDKFLTEKTCLRLAKDCDVSIAVAGTTIVITRDSSSGPPTVHSKSKALKCCSGAVPSSRVI